MNEKTREGWIAIGILLLPYLFIPYIAFKFGVTFIMGIPFILYGIYGLFRKKIWIFGSDLPLIPARYFSNNKWVYASSLFFILFGLLFVLFMR